MSLLGKSLDGGTGFYPRGSEAGPAVDHAVFDQYISPSYNELRVADAGTLEPNVLQDGVLFFPAMHGSEKQKEKNSVGQADGVETEEPIIYSDDSDGFPMEEPDIGLTEEGLQDNENGDLYGVNSDGEVVVFTYQKDGMATDEFVVYERDGNGIKSFRNNETIWNRVGDGQWQVLNGTTPDIFNFTIDINKNGVVVKGEDAEMVPVPA